MYGSEGVNLVVKGVTTSLPGRSACQDPGRDPDVTIVNPTEISVTYGYVI